MYKVHCGKVFMTMKTLAENTRFLVYKFTNGCPIIEIGPITAQKLLEQINGKIHNRFGLISFIIAYWAIFIIQFIVK